MKIRKGNLQSTLQETEPRKLENFNTILAEAENNFPHFPHTNFIKFVNSVIKWKQTIQPWLFTDRKKMDLEEKLENESNRNCSPH